MESMNYGYPNDPNQVYEMPLQLETINSEELSERRFKRVDFLVSSLLKPGLAVLAGSPKVGKSWLVLSLCLHIARGEPFWGMSVKKGVVLYLALEDTQRRLQDRIQSMEIEPSRDLYLAVNCHPLGDKLEQELVNFCKAYPDTCLIVIDTFQKIRAQGRELSYANDYQEVSRLKNLADQLNVCILLVHHTRKQGDADYMNEISGTNGIAGSADTLMVIKKENRTEGKAMLSCTGRDIEDREMELSFDRSACMWELKTDTLTHREEALPEDMEQLIAYLKEIGSFGGTSSAFCEGYNAYAHRDCSTVMLKRKMARWRYLLEDRGVDYYDFRTKKDRMIQIVYSAEADTTLERSDAPRSEGVSAAE